MPPVALEITAGDFALAAGYLVAREPVMRRRGISRESVTRGRGTRNCPKDFPSAGRHNHRTSFFFRERIMSNPSGTSSRSGFPAACSSPAAPALEGRNLARNTCAYILVSMSRTNAEDDDDNNSHHCAARLAAWRGRRILRTPPIWRKRIGRHPRPDPDYTSGAMANRLPWSRANMTCVRSVDFPKCCEASPGDVAFSSTERDRHLGIRPVPQLNTWPVLSPANASRPPSRDAAHHSGCSPVLLPFPYACIIMINPPPRRRGECV
jgi:hypothetical protein